MKSVKKGFLSQNEIINLLKKSIDYVDRVSLLKNSISNNLIQENYNEAWSKFQDMIEGLNSLNELLINLEKIYSLDYENLYCEGETLDKKINNFNIFLNKIIGSMENKDYLNVADLIEFEFDEHLESYKNIFSCLIDFLDNIN